MLGHPGEEGVAPHSGWAAEVGEGWSWEGGEAGAKRRLRMIGVPLPHATAKERALSRVSGAVWSAEISSTSFCISSEFIVAKGYKADIP